MGIFSQSALAPWLSGHVPLGLNIGELYSCTSDSTASVPVTLFEVVLTACPQAKLLTCFMEQYITHPAFTVAVGRKPAQQAQAAAASSASGPSSSTPPGASSSQARQQQGPQTAGQPGTQQPGSDTAQSPAQQQAPSAPAAKQPKGGSRVSLLLDVPLLTVNCFTELPAAFSNKDEVLSRLEQAQQSGYGA